ncbi:MAG: ABC transporter permease [Thermomicrobiales bacterium]
MSTPFAVGHRGPAAHWWAVLVGTARAVIKRYSAYLVDVIRWPLSTLLFFLTLWVTYDVSGLSEVAGANVAGFLLIGMLGMEAWNSTVWSSGYAFEHERHEGTVSALFLSPASRVAVIMGYGVGSFIWSLPSLAMVGLLSLVTGASFNVTDPFAVVAAMLAMYAGSLCTGFALAGLFVLSRRGNVLANFLQLPIWILAGFVVPRSELPDWLQPLSNAIPASHAIDALRGSTLTGESLTDVSTTLLASLAVSAGFVIVGLISLRRVEYAAKRSGTLDFY